MFDHPCPDCKKDGRLVGRRKYLIDYHCEEHGYFAVKYICKVQPSRRKTQ